MGFERGPSISVGFTDFFVVFAATSYRIFVFFSFSFVHDSTQFARTSALPPHLGNVLYTISTLFSSGEYVREK